MNLAALEEYVEEADRFDCHCSHCEQARKQQDINALGLYAAGVRIHNSLDRAMPGPERDHLIYGRWLPDMPTNDAHELLNIRVALDMVNDRWFVARAETVPIDPKDSGDVDPSQRS